RPILSGYLFPADKEQEFYANMQAGNDAICIELIWRMLDQLHAKDESAQQFKQFTHGVIQKTLRILEVYKIETDSHEPLQDLLRKVDECYTVDQLKGFFRQ